MNTLKRLANRLVFCAVGAEDQPSYLHHLSGDRVAVTSDKQLRVIHHYLAEEVEPVGEMSKDNGLVQYQEYYGRADIYLAVVRAVIAAVHVKASSQPKLALLFLTTVEKYGLSPYEQETLNREFKHPSPIQGIVRLVQTSQIALLIYMLSWLTLDRGDISAEGYLRELAAGLDLADKASSAYLPDMDATFLM
ncbi:MAG: DUF533 domain-containing protein [Cellvibrionaceae bacterium]|nr:DUF533 domain-containing protein [Cellvibrionaceae bacterium]